MLVHIIDDDESVCDSLTVLLRGEKFDTRTYRSASDFLASADSRTPGCVVTDVRMPGMDGLELMTAMKQRGLTLPVIVITGHGNVALAVKAMKGGALDFIEKPYSASALIEAVRHGCRSVSEAGKEFEHVDLLARGANIDKLSPREREVLGKVIDGLPNKVIAYEMGLSVRTVETHRAAIMMKTRAGSLAELVRMCIAKEISR